MNRVQGRPPYKELKGEGSATAQADNAWEYSRSRSNMVIHDIFMWGPPKHLAVLSLYSSELPVMRTSWISALPCLKSLTQGLAVPYRCQLPALML